MGLLAAASVLVSAGAAELGLRLLHLPRSLADFQFLSLDRGNKAYVEDDALFWRYDRLGSDLYVNDLGLRGWLPRGKPSPGAVRIACVGDSCTAGVNLEYEDVYAIRLETELRKAFPNREIETFLAAVPGYSTYQDRILFDRFVTPLRPNITIFYCGAWNDFTPAVGRSDSQYGKRGAEARRSVFSDLRIVSLITGLFGHHRVSEAERAAILAAAKEGRAPDGRRVSLAEFEDNMEHMVATAQATGSHVVIVVPPLHSDALVAQPIALEYRACLLDVARRYSTGLVDAPLLFADREQRCPPEWRTPPFAKSLCFQDWMHPSPHGHAILAGALLELLAPRISSQAQPDAAEGQGPRRTRPNSLRAVCRPAEVDWLTTDPIVLEGSQLVASGTFDRVWLGGWWIPSPRRPSAERVLLDVPRAAPPGRHVLQIVDDSGTHPVSPPITIRPPCLTASLHTEGGVARLRLSGRGPGGAAVTVWISDRRGTQKTRFGDFRLGVDARPPGLPDAPFRFDKLPLPHAKDRVRADGTWLIDLPVHADRGLPSEVFVQGLILLDEVPVRGALTELAVVRLPR